jgi:autotransporter translocation and assembly factor TamB
MSLRLPRFEEIAAAVIGGFTAYVFLLGAPYTLLAHTERQIDTLAAQIEAAVPGLDIDPRTATWVIVSQPRAVEARFTPGAAP